MKCNESATVRLSVSGIKLRKSLWIIITVKGYIIASYMKKKQFVSLSNSNCNNNSLLISCRGNANCITSITVIIIYCFYFSFYLTLFSLQCLQNSANATLYKLDYYCYYFIINFYY